MTTTRIINGRHYVPALQAQHDINAARAERDAARLALATARRDALEEAAKRIEAVTVYSAAESDGVDPLVIVEDPQIDPRNRGYFSPQYLATLIRALTEAK